MTIRSNTEFFERQYAKLYMDLDYKISLHLVKPYTDKTKDKYEKKLAELFSKQAEALEKWNEYKNNS